jgi:hypothetical protein
MSFAVRFEWWGTFPSSSDHGLYASPPPFPPQGSGEKCLLTRGVFNSFAWSALLRPLARSAYWSLVLLRITVGPLRSSILMSSQFGYGSRRSLHSSSVVLFFLSFLRSLQHSLWGFRSLLDNVLVSSVSECSTMEEVIVLSAQFAKCEV